LFIVGRGSSAGHGAGGAAVHEPRRGEVAVGQAAGAGCAAGAADAAQGAEGRHGRLGKQELLLVLQKLVLQSEVLLLEAQALNGHHGAARFLVRQA
jgi:hypothetical protein